MYINSDVLSHVGKRKFVRYSLAFVLLLSQLASAAELVIIVHPSNHAKINKQNVKNIFLGRSKTFTDGSKASPLDLEDMLLKKMFVKHYLGKNQSSLDSYWSRMIFTGEGLPPKSYNSQQEIKHRVANNPDAISYIDRHLADGTVRIIDLN